MVKEDSKLILQNTPFKKRLTSYLDANFAKGRPNGRSPLSDQELYNLWDSFRTAEELEVLAQGNRLTKSLLLLCDYLQQLVLQFTAEMYQINGYALLWDAYQREEDLLNAILHEIKDEKTKEQVLKKILKSQRLMSNTRQDKDGFISIDVGKATGNDKSEDPYTLRYLIQGWSIRATDTVESAKATIQAIRQVLEEKGYNLKSVKDTLKGFEEHFKKDWSVLPKFSKATLGDIGTGKENNADLLKGYWIYPIYEEVEPDEQLVKNNVDDIKRAMNG